MIRQRDPRVVDAKYKAWIARAPCIACFVLRGELVHGVHVAHLRAGSPEHGKRPTGMGEKPTDYWCLPLCPAHHMDGPDAQHRMGERAFYERMHVDPFDLCLKLKAAYDTKRPPGAVIIKSGVVARQAFLRGF